MPSDQNLYMPILVGAVENYKDGIVFQRDDEGENISDKNPYYNELTAIYWAWKNLKGVDAIGLVHYRRFFFIKHGRKLEDVLTKSEVENLLSKYSVILPRKRNYYIETNYSHYIHAHHAEALNMVEKIITEQFQDYANSFEVVMNRHGAHMFNMFIMNKKSFDSYCTWVFSVLSILEDHLDITRYSRQEKRVFGYIAELLMDVWVEKNKIVFKEVSWRQIGKRHFFKKAVFFILRKIGIKNLKTHF